MAVKIKGKRSTKSIIFLVFAISLGIFFLLLITWGVDLGIHAVHLFRIADSIHNDASQIQPIDLVVKVQQAANDISGIDNGIEPFLPIFNALQGLPGIGQYLGQIDPLVQYVDGLAQAGKEIAIGLEPMLLSPPSSQLDISLPKQLVMTLQSGHDHFAYASQQLNQAALARGRIRPELMPTSLRQRYQQLDGKFDLIMAGTQLLQSVPEILGAGSPQSYLVLAQNQDELRATGGFISAIGRLVIKDGQIMQFDLGDSYSVDDFSKSYPKPPDALKRFMLADYWVTRDANWSPDFPTAAREVQTLYTLSTGNTTQGVIAFDQLAVKRLLELIGPVQVPGTAEPVSADNVEAYMQAAWAQAPGAGFSQEWWLHRKDFMPQLGLVMLDKILMTTDQGLLFDLGWAVLDLVEQGQVQLYFNHPKAQAALMVGDLGGALLPGDGDYLYLVDSNVGFNKVDAVIQRSIAYNVDLRDLNQPVGEATLSYQHTGTGDLACKQEISYGNGTYQDMQRRCYLDYWRLYVPGGAQLISNNAQAVPADQLLSGEAWSGQVESFPGEVGSQVFAGLLMLPPGQSTQISVSYQLPSGVVKNPSSDERLYSVIIQKQPGLESLPVALKIQLPNDAGVLTPGDGWQQMDRSTWAWQGTLDQAIQLSLNFKTGGP